ncbi:MAG: hypothetical protein J6K32_10935 [Clostridia bacterium]|nr:hypothetical protein [Clostridia bacterium]
MLLRMLTPQRIQHMRSSIARFYGLWFAILLTMCFLAMFAQLFIDGLDLLFITIFLAAVWLMVGPLFLLVWWLLGRYAARLEWKKAFMQRTSEDAQILSSARTEVEKIRKRTEEAKAAKTPGTAAQPPAAAHEDASSGPMRTTEYAAQRDKFFAQIDHQKDEQSDTPEESRPDWREKQLAALSAQQAEDTHQPAQTPEQRAQDKIIGHAEDAQLRHEHDPELLRRDSEDGCIALRMNEAGQYYYIDKYDLDDDGTLVLAGSGPVSEHDALRIALPDHPEIAARVLAAADQEMQDELRHTINEILDEESGEPVTNAARDSGDGIHIWRETVFVFRKADGIEFRLSHTVVTQNTDTVPRKRERMRWLTIPNEDLMHLTPSQGLLRLRDTHPFDSAWYTETLLGDPDFTDLFGLRDPDDAQ